MSAVGRKIFGSGLNVRRVAGRERSWWRGVIGLSFGTFGGADER